MRLPPTPPKMCWVGEQGKVMQGLKTSSQHFLGLMTAVPLPVTNILPCLTVSQLLGWLATYKEN